MNRLLWIAAVWTLAVAGARAEDVRYYEKDGVTYCETRRTVTQRVPQTTWQEAPRTVYYDQVATENRQAVRTTWVPVTEYALESYWVNRWNPFAEPYRAYEYVPRTRWEPRTEQVQVPVACRRLVPQTQTVRTPVTTWQTVEQEIVTRVAVRTPAPVAPADPNPAPVIARRDAFGGIGRLDDSALRATAEHAGRYLRAVGILARRTAPNYPRCSPAASELWRDE